MSKFKVGDVVQVLVEITDSIKMYRMLFGKTHPSNSGIIFQFEDAKLVRRRKKK